MNQPLPTHDMPDETALSGNVKVTREDWLNAAMDVLIRDGVERVKVMTLGERLGVSRSSFYWYFKDRQDLLDALLDHWQGSNTAAIQAQADAPAETITGAVCNYFRCVIDERLFNNPLDFAIRDWARRSAPVRAALDRSDAARVAALAGMFERFDYPPHEALIRARVLYFMQLGYDMADLNETSEERLKNVPMYLFSFTGQHPLPEEIEEFTAYALAATKGDTT